ncbi:alcohol dehydrogenase catalytic domain-containing protein [Nocardia niigatensis]
MRALIGGAGPNWQLRDVDAPSRLGAVRIQVMAAGLNRADLYALDGSYTANSQEAGEFTAGMEVAGIVETSSPPASHLRRGELGTAPTRSRSSTRRCSTVIRPPWKR